MKARRQYRRFIRRLEVEFSSRDRQYRGISSNFSLGGLFVRTNHPFAPGTIVDLTVHLPNGTAAALKGQVKMALKTPVVSLRNGMGVEIIERDPRFVDFVKSLSREESPAEEGDTDTASRSEGAPAGEAKPDPQDFSIISCSACGVRNRVPGSRMSQAMRCGKCGASLTPPA